MSLFKEKEFKLIIGLFLFMLLFYKLVYKDDEDQRRKELRIKYYL